MTHGLLGEYEKAAEILERVLLVYEDHFVAPHGRWQRRESGQLIGPHRSM